MFLKFIIIDVQIWIVKEPNEDEEQVVNKAKTKTSPDIVDDLKSRPLIIVETCCFGFIFKALKDEFTWLLNKTSDEFTRKR